MIPLRLGHDSLVELSRLVVFGSRAFVGPVRLAAEDVRADLHGGFNDGFAGKGWSARGGRVRLVAVWELKSVSVALWMYHEFGCHSD